MLFRSPDGRSKAVNVILDEKQQRGAARADLLYRRQHRNPPKNSLNGSPLLLVLEKENCGPEIEYIEYGASSLPV